MANLLGADLYRLRKSLLFRGLLLFQALYGLYTALTWTRGTGTHFLLAFTDTAGLTIAVLASVFLGADYSCGTIRNKLTAGHGRACVYLADLLALLLAALGLSGAYLAAFLAAGVPRAGLPEVSPVQLAAAAVAAALTVTAFCALFTCINMLCGRMALSVLVCVLAVIVLTGVSADLFDALGVPAQTTMDVITESGSVITDVRANPDALSGPLRTLCQLLLDLLPTGQVIRFRRPLPAGELLRLAGCAAAFSGALTALGLLLFQRKDVR